MAKIKECLSQNELDLSAGIDWHCDSLFELPLERKRTRSLLQLTSEGGCYSVLLERMAAVHRAIFVWFWLLMFLVLLVLRLDRKVEWNWFVVFLPMWVLDSTFFGASMVQFTQTVKSLPRSTNANNANNNTNRVQLRRVLASAVGTILALAFQIMLCIRLQYGEFLHFSLYYVMIPFWLLLCMLIADLSYCLVQIYRH